MGGRGSSPEGGGVSTLVQLLLVFSAEVIFSLVFCTAKGFLFVNLKNLLFCWLKVAPHKILARFQATMPLGKFSVSQVFICPLYNDNVWLTGRRRAAWETEVSRPSHERKRWSQNTTQGSATPSRQKRRWNRQGELAYSACKLKLYTINVSFPFAKFIRCFSSCFLDLFFWSHSNSISYENHLKLLSVLICILSCKGIFLQQFFGVGSCFFEERIGQILVWNILTPTEPELMRPKQKKNCCFNFSVVLFQLKKELDNFGPDFFEEIEDLKYNYREAVHKNVQYEEQLLQLEKQFGVSVNIPSLWRTVWRYSRVFLTFLQCDSRPLFSCDRKLIFSAEMFSFYCRMCPLYDSAKYLVFFPPIPVARVFPGEHRPWCLFQFMRSSVFIHTCAEMDFVTTDSRILHWDVSNSHSWEILSSEVWTCYMWCWRKEILCHCDLGEVLIRTSVFFFVPCRCGFHLTRFSIENCPLPFFFFFFFSFFNSFFFFFFFFILPTLT